MTKPSKNGDLVVKGTVVNDLDIQSFTRAEDMTAWELDGGDGAYAAYNNKYGKGACERDGINHLRDLFGDEFDASFFARKDHLIHPPPVGKPIHLIISGSDFSRDNDHVYGYTDDLETAKTLVAALNERGHIHLHRFHFETMGEVNSVDDAVFRVFLSPIKTEE